MNGLSVKDERERLTALDSFDVFDTPPEDEFDFLAQLASEVCGTEMAGISLIGEDRQFYKASIGLPFRETPREGSFCEHALASSEPMVVENAANDARFRDSPLVVGDPAVRFYAGAPLRTADGHVLGTLCVMDPHPGHLDDRKLARLRGLAHQATALLEHRRHERDLSRTQRWLDEGERLAHVATWEYDVKGDRWLISAEMKSILGLEADGDADYETFLEMVVEDDRARVEAVIRDSMRTGESFAYRARIVRPDGAERTIDARGSTQLGVDGRAMTMRGATADVTDLVMAETRSREQAMGLRSAFETALDGMFVFDDERTFTHVNPAAAALLGYSQSDLRGMTINDVIPEGGTAEGDAAWQVLREHGTLRGELELKRSDGTRVITEFAATLNFRPGRHLAIIRDITDRRRADHELRRQADVLDQIPAGIVASDAERVITQWSRGAENLLGIQREAAVGRRVDELGIFPPQSMQRRGEMMQRVDGGETWEDELDVRHSSGRVFPALVTNSSVQDEHGETIGYVGVMLDATAKREAELELRRSRLETIHRLARAVEMRDIETGGHIERIGAFAAVIAERVGLEPDRIEKLRIASPMHDVGKIGIADDILLKPGQLTGDEQAEMQRHAEIGHKLLAGSGSEMLELAASIALTHHEWVDGSGYPRGRRGEEIPLEGRIVAVADVFDALTSDRVYRPAFSVEQATAMMNSERGTHFDPVVLRALLDELGTILAIRAELGADSPYHG